jgi:hypothetical protein
MYDPSVDPSIPKTVARIVQPHCDVCWDGGREGEIWFDAKGHIVQQTTDAE